MAVDHPSHSADSSAVLLLFARKEDASNAVKVMKWVA